MYCSCLHIWLWNVTVQSCFVTLYVSCRLDRRIARTCCKVSLVVLHLLLALSVFFRHQSNWDFRHPIWGCSARLSVGCEPKSMLRVLGLNFVQDKNWVIRKFFYSCTYCVCYSYSHNVQLYFSSMHQPRLIRSKINVDILWWIQKDSI